MAEIFSKEKVKSKSSDIYSLTKCVQVKHYKPRQSYDQHSYLLFLSKKHKHKKGILSKAVYISLVCSIVFSPSARRASLTRIHGAEEETRRSPYVFM